MAEGQGKKVGLRGCGDEPPASRPSITEKPLRVLTADRQMRWLNRSPIHSREGAIHIGTLTVLSHSIGEAERTASTVIANRVAGSLPPPMA
jgi:hypothetical protein